MPWWPSLRKGESPLAPDVVEVDTDLGLVLLPVDTVMLPWVRHYRTWEPAEADLFRSVVRPGMTVADVGAHVGLHTLLFAQLVGPTGKVVAVEPDVANAMLLRENVRRAGLENVAVVEAAAGRRVGRARFVRSESNSGDHRVVRRRAPNAHWVPEITLDRLFPSPSCVQVVKIDVQGTDHHVVEGMKRCLARCQPIVIVEFWPEGIRDRGEEPARVAASYFELPMDLRVLGDSGPVVAPSDLISAAEGQEGGFCTLVLTRD